MANSYIYNLTDSRWTDGNTTYDGFKLRIIASNSHQNSNFIKFQYNSDVNFRVRKDGTVFANTLVGKLRMTNGTVPASSNSPGTEGDVAWDSTYLYLATANNEWKRIAFAAW